MLDANRDNYTKWLFSVVIFPGRLDGEGSDNDSKIRLSVADI